MDDQFIANKFFSMHQEAYIKAIKNWLQYLEENPCDTLDSTQKALNDIQGLRQNLDWMETNVTKQLNLFV